MTARDKSRAPGLVTGFTAPLRGAAIILHHPRLLPYCIFPFIIGFVAVALWAVACYFGARAGIEWLGGVTPGILRWPVYIGAAITAVALALVLGFVLFVVFVQVIASPFNSVLSERTEKILGCTVPVLESSFWRETAAGAWVSIVVLGRSLAITVGLLPLNLVPVFGNAAYTVLTIFINSNALALEVMDYSLERRYRTLGERMEWIRLHRPATLGLGLGVALILLLPVVNMLLLPACVVGGTEMFVRLSGDGAEAQD